MRWSQEQWMEFIDWLARDIFTLALLLIPAFAARLVFEIVTQ